MQIFLTKKLIDATGIKVEPANDAVHPIFCWTANWTKVWENRRTEDMLIMMNNANRFTVAIYQVKRKDLKNLEKILREAIINTFRYLNLNPEIIEDYLQMAGPVRFAQNHDRTTAAWLTRTGLDCSFNVGRRYNGVTKMFNDTVGATYNYSIVNSSGKEGKAYIPHREMFTLLAELTGKPLYRYRAMELEVTLDLKTYQAKRRILVPADIELQRLHMVLQRAFSWRDCHLYDFIFYTPNQPASVVRLVPDEGSLAYDERAIAIENHTLTEYLKGNVKARYTYDFGDDWIHEIRIMRIIEDCDRESPYLLEASGQTPPEDVGGIDGYLQFREIMLNPKHPEYARLQRWSMYWQTELSDWYSHPRPLHF